MNRHTRHIIYLFSVIVIALLSSCDKDNGKSTEIALGDYESDYGELAEKYAEMKFETCADAIAAGNEIASVLYATSNKAFNENDAKAKSDLEHFGELVSAYDYAMDSMYHKCPEDFDNWKKDNRKKIDAILHKAEQMFNMHDTDSVWGEDVTSEIEAVNEQVEQLMIDIQHFVEEDDSINDTK